MQSTNNNNNNSEMQSPDIRPYDILCGRSKTCFNNIGNRRFRITISMNLKKFDALPNRSERGKFIGKLARTLKEDAGFRFIRISKKHGRIELSDEEIRAKIGHALRDLSKAQAEAAANMAKTTQEAQKVFASSPMATSSSSTTPLPQTETLPQAPPLTDTMKPAPIVTPQVPQRSMIQDTIRKEDYFHHYNDQDDISDISQDDHAMDLVPAQHHMPLHEDSMKMPPLVPIVTQTMECKPSYKPNQDLGDDDYCLMPLFNETQVLDQVPMDLFEQDQRPIAAATNNLRSTFDLDHHDIMDDLPYEEFQSRCSLSN